MQLTHGSLFSGIGGFDLGFERAGIKTVWQVEIEPYCRAVLAKHFPDAKLYDDIRTCGLANLERVDILSGGFPCQDISNAGKRAGIDGERSGLWSEYARLIRELRPRFVVVENVAALLHRGMERVLGDLAACGYDAEWQSIRASDVGAPHRRERIWIVAYRGFAVQGEPSGRDGLATCGGETILDSSSIGLPRPRVFETSGDTAANCDKQANHALSEYAGQWAVEPDVGRVANGIPARVDRLRGLGNAIVPQIAEFIGHQILMGGMKKCHSKKLFCA
jgi:DNA (cytosine-5)-methyltransferase 1